MAIIIRKNKSKWQLPSPGQHVAVWADAIDKGVNVTRFGPKDSVRLVYFVDERGADGQLLQVWVNCNSTVDERSRLFPHVSAWLDGATMPDPVVLSRFVGRNVILVIAHVVDKLDPQKVWANVTAVFPPPKNTVLLQIPADYVPVATRGQIAQNPAATNASLSAAVPAPGATSVNVTLPPANPDPSLPRTVNPCGHAVKFQGQPWCCNLPLGHAGDHDYGKVA